MAKKTIHIVPKEQGWVVKKEGAQRISGSADTKTEAYEIAREIALNQGLDIVVHGKDGKIQKSNERFCHWCPMRSNRHIINT